MLATTYDCVNETLVAHTGLPAGRHMFRKSVGLIPTIWCTCGWESTRSLLAQNDFYAHLDMEACGD